MEFDLHIVTNGNRANISLEYDNPNSIDNNKLKNAINDVVECLINAKALENDFKPNNQLILQNNDIENNKQPDYIKDVEQPSKFSNSPDTPGAIKFQENDKDALIVDNNRDYLSYIVISQIKCDKITID